MGRSNSIKQQQESNQAFREYVDKMTEDLEKRQQNITKELEGMISEHYKQYSDKASLMEGKYAHLTTLSEWSLDSVNSIIKACSKAIFDGKAPKGTDEKQQSPEVSASVAEMKKRELYIASVAFDVVQSIMSTFTNKTSTSIETKIDAKPVAPGMTLFIGVVNNSYSRKDFFRNETIVQSMFVFKVYYSIKEGQTVTKLNDLEAYENLKVKYRQQIDKISVVIGELDFMADDYFDKLNRYSSIVDIMNGKLKEINNRIAELSDSSSTEVLNSIVRIGKDNGDSDKADLKAEKNYDVLCSKVKALRNKAYANWLNNIE